MPAVAHAVHKVFIRNINIPYIGSVSLTLPAPKRAHSTTSEGEIIPTMDTSEMAAKLKFVVPRRGAGFAMIKEMSQARLDTKDFVIQLFFTNQDLEPLTMTNTYLASEFEVKGIGEEGGVEVEIIGQIESSTLASWGQKS